MSDPILPFSEVVIPAELGWSLLTYVDPPILGVVLDRVLVIAWLVQLYHIVPDETFVHVYPLTVNGSLEFEIGDYALQFGDQSKFYTFGAEFFEEESLIAYLKKNSKKS